jgi:hypothetical protein
MKMRARKSNNPGESGIALLTTLLLLLLMSSLLVGFILLINSGQRLSGMNNDYGRAFYGAEAAMEKMTADLGSLFDQNYAPTAGQISTITAAPPVINGVKFLKADGTSGYELTPSAVDANGNPAATTQQIKSGAYQGMTALATNYKLEVTARTPAGSEVVLQRTTQTVGIPMFQFGIFSDTDLSFFAGPDFNFGGRVHTNGNLFLAEGDGKILTMSDRVTAVKDIIRTNLSNGWATTSQYTGTVNITTSPGTSSYRAMARSEGSLTGTLGTSPNPNWPNISLGTTNYAGNVRSGSTGATKLNLGIVTLGAGSTQAIDLIRRPVSNTEDPLVTGQRYFAQASLKILLSDDPQDIMQLPCIDTSVQPFDLSKLAVQSWSTTSTYGPAISLAAKMLANGTLPLPLAASGAATGAGAYSSLDGYWLPYNKPIINGFIKIEAQLSPYGSPCGVWQDVTQEILSYGYAGGNLNPQGSVTWSPLVPTSAKGVPLLALPTSSAIGPNPCASPHPNAIIRLERVRDNPSTWTSGNHCGAFSTTSLGYPSDFWPNVLFDVREGTLRDVTPSSPNNVRPTLNGVMNYIELDAANLAKWFAGTLGTSGPSTYDPNVAPNDFVVYISDRRGNYAASKTWSGNWPPLSPQGHETGEYGWNDFANPGNASNGCPNNALDAGEDLDATGQLYTYGASPARAQSVYGTFSGLSTTGTALTANPSCSAPSYASPVWPMVYATINNAARENPPLFFRRAVKIVNGKNLTALGTCPGSVPCGLTIASENPVYLQGDFNANSSGGGFNDPHVATSIAADAVTLLSKNWNDVNSFSYNLYVSSAPRSALTTYYRTAVLAGKGVSFPQPSGTGNDFGTDGGVHNFLRFMESWTGQALNYRGSIISMYYDRAGSGVYKCCTTVYSPPSRVLNFDVEFLQPNLLPPRTPLFRDVNTTGFTQLLLPEQH